jgi:hypothetical protein
MSDEERGIEAIIRAAMERGDFDDLPGQGKPLDLSAYFEAPEDQRLALSVLKNADVLPREVELLKAIGALRDELQACTDAAEGRRLRKAIREQMLKLSVMLERGRSGRSRRAP